MFNKKVLKTLICTVLSISVLIIAVRVINCITIKNSEAYDLALSYVKSQPELIEQLGEIQSFGKYPRGGIGNENGKTVAQIETKVIASKWSGNIIVLMEKYPNKEWIFKTIYLDEK